MCSGCGPHSTGASAFSDVRTTLLYGFCAVSDTLFGAAFVTAFTVAFPALATVLSALASFKGLRAFGLATAFLGDCEEVSRRRWGNARHAHLRYWMLVEGHIIREAQVSIVGSLIPKGKRIADPDRLLQGDQDRHAPDTRGQWSERLAEYGSERALTVGCGHRMTRH